VAVPNHSRWPLLVYPARLRSPVRPGGGFRGSVRPQWLARRVAQRRLSVHHFHCNAHEALGVYSGEVTVEFGGDGGVVITARPGDVIVLPAGTGHKKLSSHGQLGIVGAYPAGQHPDMCTPLASNLKRKRRRGGARGATATRSGLRRQWGRSSPIGNERVNVNRLLKNASRTGTTSPFFNGLQFRGSKGGVAPFFNIPS
jgi:uncharacterized protein YjlB